MFNGEIIMIELEQLKYFKFLTDTEYYRMVIFNGKNNRIKILKWSNKLL